MAGKIEEADKEKLEGMVKDILDWMDHNQVCGCWVVLLEGVLEVPGEGYRACGRKCGCGCVCGC